MLTKEDLQSIKGVVADMVKMVMPMSKVQAYSYLNMRRSNFDRYVRDGLLPKGKDIVGFKEKVWYRVDLDSAVARMKRYGYRIDTVVS